MLLILRIQCCTVRVHNFISSNLPAVMTVSGQLHPVPLTPLLVQQLLEFLVSHELLVPVQDGDVEVGVHVATVRTGLKKGLDLKPKLHSHLFSIGFVSMSAA